MKKVSLIFLIILMNTNLFAQNSNFNLIVGTYTNSCESNGIYVYEFNPNTAEFKLKNSSEKTINPSYLTLSNDNKFLYATNENGAESTISAFDFNSKTGKIGFINKEKSEGNDPCYIINDAKNVIVANYSGGNIAVFGKEKNGGLTNVKQIIQHKGKSVNKQRQESPHVHMVYFSPDKKYVLVNDLGTDNLYVYKYNPTAESGILILKNMVPFTPGSGPRHLTFSKDGKSVYVLNELNGSISTFNFNDGILKKTGETTVVAPEFKGKIGAADIHITPDGKFLYATNRGEANTISIFKVLENGMLESIGQTKTLGNGPRNFTIDPSGNFLLVGNQYTNNIVIFKIDKATGMLTDTGKRIDLCAPVCLVFSKI